MSDRMRTRLLADPQVRTVTRPATSESPEFELAYARTGGAPGRTPIVVVPGGPGLASVLPYRKLRKRAERAGLDLVMVEHRGIGLSRRDPSGTDLPISAMTLTQVVDDVAAVLDAEGIDRTILYGCSYGSDVVQGVGVRHPARVSGMILDSTGLGPEDYVETRHHVRELLWRGARPETARVAFKLRSLVDDAALPLEEAGEVARIVYEFSGPAVLEALLNQVKAGRGRRTWRWLASLGSAEIERNSPYVMEFDLAGVIAYREFHAAPEPDGLPLDPAAGFARIAERFPPFEGAPFELRAELPEFDWPVVVLAGERDLRTPPAIAAEVARLAGDGHLITFPDMGHSVLDTRAAAAMTILESAAAGGITGVLASRGTIVATAARAPRMSVDTMIRASLRFERVLPRGHG